MTSPALALLPCAASPSSPRSSLGRCRLRRARSSGCLTSSATPSSGSSWERSPSPAATSGWTTGRPTRWKSAICSRCSAPPAHGRRVHGVGPEQNFSYIASIKPAMAFIVDIRRQAVMQHLMYKAMFEMSKDRADFISMLFSLPRPAGVDAAAPIGSIWTAFASVSRRRGDARQRREEHPRQPDQDARFHAHR